MDSKLLQCLVDKLITLFQTAFSEYDILIRKRHASHFPQIWYMVNK